MDMSTLQTPVPKHPLPEGKISYEQFLEWLDEDTWAEWVDGVLCSAGWNIPACATWQ